MNNEAPTTDEKPKIEIPQQPKQNGITRPVSASRIGQLWDIADEESEKLGRPVPRKVVIDRFMAEIAGANAATAATQYARWVKFHGAESLLKAAREAEMAEAKAAREAEAKAAKEAKEAEKAKIEAEKEAARVEKERLAAEKAEAAAAAKAQKEADKLAKKTVKETAA